MKLSKSKLIPGKGFQYTPKTTVKWADEFNELLDNFSSRNELISKLIEDGLKAWYGSKEEKGIYLPLEKFNSDQLNLLKTEEGQRILYNVVSLILGNSESAAFASQVVQPISSGNKTVSQQVDLSNRDDAVEKEEKVHEVKNNSNDALSKLMKLGKMTSLKG